MNVFRFSKKAERLFRKIDSVTQNNILQKLSELKEHPRIFAVLEHLADMEPATHRLRISDYRLLLRSEGESVFIILKVGHRSNVYQ